MHPIFLAVMMVGDSMIKNKVILQEIEELEKQYKDDPDALDHINRLKETVLYCEGIGNEERAISAVEQTKVFLQMWH